MNEFVSISVALLLAILGGQLAREMKLPRIVGQLVLGLLCSVPLIKNLLSGDQSLAIIETMSEVGVVLLLFLTGFDINLRNMKKVGRDTLIIAMSGAIVPFTLGFLLAIMFSMSVQAAIILGACLSVTAEGTTVALLTELKKINSRVGSVLVGAGIIDDLFEVLFLAFVLTMSHEGAAQEMMMLPLKAIGFALLSLMVAYALPPIVHGMEKQRDVTNILSLAILTSLILAIGSNIAGLGSVLGAFIGGVLMQHSFARSDDRAGEDHMLQALAFSLFIPFFFVEIGLHFDAMAILRNPGMTSLVLLTAVAGKLLGTMLTRPFVSFNLKQLHLIGWGMNSRGIMELVIADIAHEAGIIDGNLYSAIIFVAITTTIMFPFAMNLLLKRNPKLMD